MLLASRKTLFHLIHSLKKFYRVVKIDSKSNDMLLLKAMSSLDLEGAELKNNPLDFIKNEKTSNLKLISINSVINKGEANYNPEANLIFVKGNLIFCLTFDFHDS